MAAATALEITPERERSLRRYNIIAGTFHALQALAILALSNGFGLPVHINYLAGPPVPGAKVYRFAPWIFDTNPEPFSGRTIKSVVLCAVWRAVRSVNCWATTSASW